MLACNRSGDEAEDVLQQHREAIIDWLDDLLQDNISVGLPPAHFICRYFKLTVCLHMQIILLQYQWFMVVCSF